MNELPELSQLTVTKVREGLDNGSFTAEYLIKLVLEHAQNVNSKFNAIIFENEAAIDAAMDIDRRIKSGDSLGPLAGVPVVVKDTMDMKGFPTTAGWKKLNSKFGGVDLFPERDSPVVTRMRAADAIIIGKTNVPILSWTGTHANDSWAGPTINPVIQDRVPGGSSAGSAASVASNMAVIALAEETGGSIQNPASAQALVGIKPTVGLVPNTGVVPLSGNRDVVGPIARTVEDAAIGLDVLAGYSTEDPKTLACVDKIPKKGYAANLLDGALKGKRVGLYGKGWRPDQLSSETAKLYTQAQDELDAAGAILVEDPFSNTDFASYRQITPGTLTYDGRGLETVAYDIACYLKHLGKHSALKTWNDFAKATQFEELLGEGEIFGYLNELPDFVEAIKSPELPPAIPEFIEIKRKYLELFSEVFERHSLDSLVYPQMLEELPGLNSGNIILETTVGELNIAGLPAVTVPAGYYRSGAPFGLIFLGPKWHESELINQAYSYEQKTFHRKPTKLG